MGIKRSKVYHNLLFDLVAKPAALIVTAFNPVKASVNFVSRSPLNMMCLQFSSVAQSCPTLCDAACQASLSITNSRSLLKLLPIESVMTSNHLILSSPSPPAFNLSQHQGLFRWVSSSHQVAKVLELQHQSFQWIFRTDFLWDWLFWSSCCPRDSQESSPTPQFKSINSSVLSFLYSPILTSKHDYWKNHSFD